MDNSKNQTTVPIKLVLSWGLVGVPLLWGVAQTLEKAMLLFQQ
jgi:hypothetical protein